MAKEHKCKKCGLTYKGFSNQCPYCHKKTKYGIFNAFMCVIGYITTFLIAIGIIYYEIFKMIVFSFALTPLLISIITIVAVIAIIIFLLK